MREIDWKDLQTINSPYEEQMSSCGRFWRHRLVRWASPLGSLDRWDQAHIELPWREGRAPK